MDFLPPFYSTLSTFTKKQQYIDITIFPLITNKYKDKSFRKTKYLFLSLVDSFGHRIKTINSRHPREEKKR